MNKFNSLIYTTLDFCVCFIKIVTAGLCSLSNHTFPLLSDTFFKLKEKEDDTDISAQNNTLEEREGNRAEPVPPGMWPR